MVVTKTPHAYSTSCVGLIQRYRASRAAAVRASEGVGGDEHEAARLMAEYQAARSEAIRRRDEALARTPRIDLLFGVESQVSLASSAALVAAAAALELLDEVLPGYGDPAPTDPATGEYQRFNDEARRAIMCFSGFTPRWRRAKR